jgi:regulator of cell morphogenesis and NO signaling
MIENKYTAKTRMSDLIEDDASLLSSVSRFGISLGFGNKTVHEACRLNGVDTETFLAVLNFLAGENTTSQTKNLEKISIETVIHYLRNAHSYFLTYKLPSIKSKLLHAVKATEQGETYSVIFMKFFDEYYDEVLKHIEYEDQIVFPYVTNLLAGKADSKFKIRDFEAHHTDIDSKLAELKKILIKHYPAKGVSYQLNDVLFDLLSCEKDLQAHNRVEDYFFVPLVETIENKKG